MLIKLYDFFLNKLISALNSAASKGRKLATLSEQLAAESLTRANELNADAAQLEARAERLKGAL